MFRGFPAKSESPPVNQNQKVHIRGLRCSGRSSEHAAQKPQNLESGFRHFELKGQAEKLTLFRGASEKSEISFVNQLRSNFRFCFTILVSDFFDTLRKIMEPPQNACYSTLSSR